MGGSESHRWIVEWSKQARASLRKLSSSDRMAVFNSVEHLAKSENPYSVPGVKKLQGAEHEGARRIRAGDYRVIFWLEAGEIVELQFTYKGSLMIDAIFIHHTGY